MTVNRQRPSQKNHPHSGDEIRSAFIKFFTERDHLVIPSASLVPEDPTVLMTIAGMLPFKPIFLGQEKAPAARAVSSQKCIRTNDIENVGRTARHQTFFEMLGNFSFGDYFKQEAITWAWELSTEVFGLNPEHLVISIFRDDHEAETIWRDVVGVNPKRIIRMDEKDNFWSSGPTGPCGPCSELYYDFKPQLGVEHIDLDDDDRFIEFYNLVFMEYNKDTHGSLTPLSNKNIDTGMGLERMAQILQKAPNNYETDLIYPIILKASSLANINYKKIDNQKRTSLKIIGDHSRAITFMISDGIRASNLGRGYILRRLIRRVIRHGKLINIKKPFLGEMGDAVIELMKSTYPKLLERRNVILLELEREESRFLETLERGEKLLTEILSKNPKKISGNTAFELYDTFGFPLELTQEIIAEHGISVELEGFEKAMKKQRERAKAATASIDLTTQGALDKMVSSTSSTVFEGYEILEKKSSVVGMVVNGESDKQVQPGDNVDIALDVTSFYGEGGGQVGDCGVITSNEESNNNLLIRISGVTRKKNIFIHNGKLIQGKIALGDVVKTKVNQNLRKRAQANHTATHLLQSALKNILGEEISQAGSLVDFNRLRFDFNYSCGVTTQELIEIEKLINYWISEAYDLEINYMSLEKAKAMGALAMFGEKYESKVRVVDIPGVSKELCGGTHVRNTSEIGLFKIINESGISAGIRRIEAIAGPAVLEFLNERDEIVNQLTNRFKAQPNEVCTRVIALQQELKETNKELVLAREELAIAKAITLIEEAIDIADNKVLIKRLDGLSGVALQKAAEKLIAKLGEKTAVILGGLPTPQDQKKVILVAAFGKGLLSRGLKAGKFIGEIAKICDGGGGGKDHLAQAGGRNGVALGKALATSMSKLEEELQ
ncbi:alanine--tRNA ligase [Prochlorococcus sp. MIT 1341]|uniref:alanine--tRNA ligase n=1 Tax=Prochlorococcus sp. MIT 1341 TaxID=3096221 RepID=UPI002A756699|nr:alanine--tRNA ligase [Prochlorococcus sp. MIT 1341]